MSEKFVEINRYFALTSYMYCNTIGQSNNAFAILGYFFGAKTKRPCFDLFIHWLIKQTTNTYETIFHGHTQITLMPTTLPYSLWNLRNYLWITRSELHVKRICLPSIIANIAKSKNELWKLVRLTSFQKRQSQSVSIFFEFSPSVTSFVLVVLFIPSFNALSGYFYVSLSLVTVLTIRISINFMTPTQFGWRNIMISKTLTRE